MSTGVGGCLRGGQGGKGMDVRGLLGGVGDGRWGKGGRGGLTQSLKTSEEAYILQHMGQAESTEHRNNIATQQSGRHFNDLLHANGRTRPMAV